jgi:serine phosphatase RsbU (regulator of sigma subunit)
VMNTLRQRALPDTDFTDPAHVLSRLNAAFLMDEHDGLCFTMWYGVYDVRQRRLRFASGGHHAACLSVPGEPTLRQLHTPGLVVGALDGAAYRNADTEVPPDSRLYLFSDGLFELVDDRGRQWVYRDVLPFIAESAPGPGEAARLATRVRDAAGARTLDDDCSVVIVTFAS